MKRLFWGAAALAAIGAGSYAAVSRLPVNVLAWAICGGLALGVGVPLLVGVLLLWRSTPRQEAEPMAMPAAWQEPAPRYTQPQIIMVPPMALPATRQQMQASWAETPGPRRYTMIGESEGGEE